MLKVIVAHILSPKLTTFVTLFEGLGRAFATRAETTSEVGGAEISAAQA